MKKQKYEPPVLLDLDEVVGGAGPSIGGLVPGLDGLNGNSPVNFPDS